MVTVNEMFREIGAMVYEQGDMIGKLLFLLTEKCTAKIRNSIETDDLVD